MSFVDLMAGVIIEFRRSLMPHRRWFVHRTNEEFIQYICRSTGVSSVFAQVLVNRGIKTPEDIRAFLEPTIGSIEPPEEIPGMKKAVEIIKGAISSGKKILVHGDYDTDGLTATAIMVRALRRLTPRVYYFIPDRFEHGYGFSEAAVEYAKALGVSLIITVDCGITSFEAVKKARQEGIGVVVTDHHQVKTAREGTPIVPPAEAVVNPQLRGDASERPNISGAMVALKLASLLVAEEEVTRLMELACLGTVADVVPLIGDNRIVVKEGLRIINDDPSAGVQALKDVASVRRLSAGLMSFTLIPRLNASGRLDNAMQVVKLLLCDDYDEALPIAETLNKLNTERQRIEQEVLEEALEVVRKRGFDRCIVAAGENWHEGVVGIVASRLAEHFYRPSFVLNIKDGIARGSARSIPEFDLYGALCRCQDLLISFGGHRQAAGLRLGVQDLERFERQMDAIVRETLTEEQLIPMLKLDASVSLRDVTNGLVKEIEALEPYGYGNPEPVFGAKAVEVTRVRTVGNNHLKVLLRQEGLLMEAIGFDMGGAVEEILEGGLYDLAFTPQINEWEGMRAVQLKLQGIRPTR